MDGLRGDGVRCDLTAKYAEASSGLTAAPAQPSCQSALPHSPGIWDWLQPFGKHLLCVRP